MKRLLILALIMVAGCEKGYIPQSDITVGDGVMTPETLLSFGRISNPQVSPDGGRVLYGVSYISIPENRSCRNLILSDIDGGNRIELTHFGKSVTCERWAPDGKSIYFIQNGQLYKAAFKGDRLGRKRLLSDIPAGISEFSLSPDGLSVLYTSTVKGPVTTPSDSDPSLDKAQAYVAQDLMYRHWDHWVTETPRSYVV
ncbi:MAG: peptidase S9, partial [Bacteroidales bacterium]|nr:peptidase S9 [Bacteroidales bacterium]